MITNKKTVDKLRDEILDALEELGEQVGMRFNLGHCRLGKDYFDIDLKARTVLPDGTISDPEKTKFQAYASDYDLDPAWFGREFTSKGSKFVISGINPKAPRFPVNAVKVVDQTGWKFTVPIIKSAMKTTGVSTS